MSETRPAVRYLAEFGVIVLGVLVALLAESAWTERGERVEEREILEWIAQDLEADSGWLADDRDWVEMVAPAVAQSRAVLEGTDSLSPTGRLAIVYASSTIRTTSSLVRTWDDLIASGRISVITDRQLRRAVIEFYGRIGEIQAGHAALPTDFRTSVIAGLPTHFTRGVLAECIRSGSGAQAGIRPDVASALARCSVAPGEDPSALLDRLQSVPGIERSLGELTYDLTGITELVDAAEASFRTLRTQLDELLAR